MGLGPAPGSAKGSRGAEWGPRCGSCPWWPPGVAVKVLGLGGTLGGTLGTCGSPGWEDTVPLRIPAACGISKCLPLILGGLLGIYI